MAIKPIERFSLKDHLFNKAKIVYLASLFKAADADFDAVAFERDILKNLSQLELKERIGLIAEVLKSHLDPDFKKAAKMIVTALPPPLDPAKTDDDFGDFIFAPLGEYVVRNGLDKRFLGISLVTLKEITKRFSMEDSIRYFINEYTEETMKELCLWATDDNYHVRRLASEGTRHLLPWSGRIRIPVTAPLPILDQLHADPTRYVTRSVANHLNDIAKVEPTVVIKTLKRWCAAGEQDSRELGWITSHALRTLVKDGDTAALALLGYRKDPLVKVSDFALTDSSKRITKDGTVSFSFSVAAKRDEQLMVDYVIDFVKANGKRAPKVFKLKKLALKNGTKVMVSKNHRFMSSATTYTLYPGVHTLTLQVNGTKLHSTTFTIS